MSKINFLLDDLLKNYDITHGEQRDSFHESVSFHGKDLRCQTGNINVAFIN